MKKALITGINGQDGSYLSELLLNKGYEVHGIIRRGSTHNPPMVNVQETKNIVFHYCDLTEDINLFKLLREIAPDELYHLGAQSDVKVSFGQPLYTSDVNALGTLRVLESVRTLGLNTKIYNAATSELYGVVDYKYPLDEQSRFHPVSPYGFSKLFAYWACRNYREAYGMFICNGILFNHESPRRGINFVTRKITNAVVQKRKLVLGNVDAVRDWGYAPEYVEAMWLMLQSGAPDDFVIATGEVHSVREFIEEAFKCVDVEVQWQGSGVDEKGIGPAGDVLVEMSSEFYRPSDVVHLVGNYMKAKMMLGWTPKTLFKDLVKIMMNAEQHVGVK